MSSKTGASSPGSPDMVTGFSGVNAEASSGSGVRSTSPLLIPPAPLAPAPPAGKQILFKNNIKKYKKDKKGGGKEKKNKEGEGKGEKKN